MQKCTPGQSETGCVTVGYSIIGDKRRERNGDYEHFHDIMKNVAD